MTVRIQKEDFDTGLEVKALLKACDNPGAVVTFTGLVRGDGGLTKMTLEHYPAMTEKALEDIEAKAKKRFALQGSLIIHRYGALKPGDQIVLVACVSEHRDDAFKAASFLMDWLKTRAPFWKKETSEKGEAWVEAREEDEKKAKSWLD